MLYNSDDFRESNKVASLFISNQQLEAVFNDNKKVFFDLKGRSVRKFGSERSEFRVSKSNRNCRDFLAFLCFGFYFISECCN